MRPPGTWATITIMINHSYHKTDKQLSILLLLGVANCIHEGFCSPTGKNWLCPYKGVRNTQLYFLRRIVCKGQTPRREHVCSLLKHGDNIEISGNRQPKKLLYSTSYFNYKCCMISYYIDSLRRKSKNRFCWAGPGFNPVSAEQCNSYGKDHPSKIDCQDCGMFAHQDSHMSGQSNHCQASKVLLGKNSRKPF